MIVFAALFALSATVPPLRVVNLRAREIRFADAFPDAVPTIADRVIATVPASRQSVTIGGEGLVSLARRAAPGLVWRNPGAIRFIAPQPARAGRGLAAPYVIEKPDIAAGQPLTLLSYSGPVRVARPVVALQPARNGSRLFVRDGDGHVLAVAVELPGSRQ